MKKRLLSWLLVLTMVVSLIPSTLVTAFAEEALAAPMAGKVTVKLNNDWPTDMNADIIDITVSTSFSGGMTLNITDGKTVIVHGTGTVSGTGRSGDTPLFIVESGGTLVLDGVTISGNKSDDGTVVVKSGGLLDLGYNDQKTRVAPSITGNTKADGATARNLVIADGATVRLNAEAKNPIGVSYAGTLVSPVALIQGGRYSINGDQSTNENKETKIVSDDNNLKFAYTYDTLVLRQAKTQILYWNPASYFVNSISTVNGNYNRPHLQNHKTILQTLDATITELVGSPSSIKSLNNLTKNTDITYYDLVFIVAPWGNLATTDCSQLTEYLKSGGTIFIQAEDTNFNNMNTYASAWSKALGADFTVESTPHIPISSTVSITSSKWTTGMDNSQSKWKVDQASPITAGDGVKYTALFSATVSGKVYNWCVDLEAGERDNGTKWGNIIVSTDANMWSTSHGDSTFSEWGYKTGHTTQFAKNLLNNSLYNRASAAAGVNPNEEIVPQAKVTTEYRTVSAALLKITEGQTAEILRYGEGANANVSYTPVENELLFENATVKDLWGNSLYAEEAGVYIDMSKKMTFNVQSGTVKVNKTQDSSFASSDYVVYLGATLNANKDGFEGGIKLSSKSSYILCAEDADSPITRSNNGPASITIPKAGQSVKVTYPGGGEVTYTAKTDNEKFYLGKYTVENKVSGDATLTTDAHPHHGETFTLTYKPTTGYELNGGVFKVAMRTKNGAQSTVPINMTKDDSHAADGYILYTSENTSYEDADCGKIGQVTVKAYFTDEVCTKVEVTVENVQSHLIVYTDGDVTSKLAPTIILIGEGKDKNGQTVELYRFNTNMSYYDGQTVKSVKSIDWSKYALTGVKVSVAEADGSEGAYTDGTLMDANKTENADNAQNLYYWVDLTKGNQYVKFTYEWNWVDVNVKAQYADGTDIPGAGRVDEMEAGKAQSIIAPSVPGYEPDAASKTITPNASGTGNEVIFTYTQITSTVELIAVDEAGHELTRVAGPTIAKNGTVDTTKIVAPTLPGYTLKAAVTPTVTGSPYDGVNNPTVTYTYTATEKALTVKAYLYDANKDETAWDILKEDRTSYAKMTPGQTLSITAPTIPGYKVKVVTNDEKYKEVKSVYLTDDANPQEVCFYYEVDPDYNSNITVKLVDADGKELGGYKIPGVADQAQVVKAPTLHGYTVDVESVTAYTNKTNNTTEVGEVKFTYTKSVWTVTVKLNDSSKTPAEDITAKAPAGYPTTIEVIKGEKVAITAPSIYGYSLAETQAAVIEETPTRDMTVTINYIPVDKSLVTITIIDKLDDGAGTTTDFMTRTETVTAGSTEKVISMLNIPGYKLTSAKIDSAEHINDVSGGALTVSTTHAAQGATITVVLTHTYNKVNVTVNAKFNGTVLGSYTIPLDKDVQTQVFAPSVEGYTPNAASQNFTPSATATEVNFTLTKNTGNVTIVVVDKDSNVELTRKDGGSVNKGSNISLSTIAGTNDANLPTIEFYKKSADAPVITVGTNTVNDGTAYDGSGDITVTYKYERKTQSITVVKKDYDTRAEISGSQQTISDLPVGKNHSFADTVSVPGGYTAMDNNPTTYYVEDRDNQTVTFWYTSAKADDYVSVTVKLINDDTNEVFQTYPVSNLRKGVAATITAPTPTGYALAAGQQQTKTVTPDGTADNDVVEFRYTVQNPKTVTITLKNNTDGSALQTPDNYTMTYTLKQGDEVTITAPAISGFSLMSATLDDTAQQNSQVVTVKYDEVKAGGSSLVFSYYPVNQANFVTHTVKFMVGANTLYTHEKMIAKGSGDKVVYSENDVKYSVPGYAFDHIDYKLGDATATADQVTNAVNATIIYHFTEDAATITIKKVENGTSNAIGTDETLTGYRKGQTVKVVAPHVEGKVLVGDLIQTVNLTNAGNTDVTFKYVNAGQVTLTLREKDGGVIKVISPGSTTTYTAGSGDLDLSTSGWTYSEADTTGVFTNGSLTISDLSTTKNYDIYYTKQTRKVEFIAVDQAKLTEAGKTLEEAITAGIDTYKIAAHSGELSETARVGESYKAVAQSFNGWNLKDQISKVYDVTAGADNLKVYFVYEAKASGTVTVHYHFGNDHDNGKLLSHYSVNAAVGETVTVTAPSDLEDGKYKLRTGQTNPVVVSVTEGGTTVEIYYEANFWTVTEKVSMDNATTEQDKHEVVKTNPITLYPPNKAGYTLVGITGAGTGGSATALPTDYADNKLTFTTSADTVVTYYYAKTTADQFQSTVTVKYQYNGYKLADDKTVQANKGQANTIDVPTFEGYTASTYTYVDGTGTAGTPTGVGNGISITPAEDTGTVTITYTRTDGSVVLPGKDNEIDAPTHDKDNVTVKPDGNTGSITGPNQDGSVTVDDDDGATVTRPTDPNNPENGKDNIKVPDGTVIKPDGTIVLPDGGGEIAPDKTLPDNTPSGYVTVTYKANGGVGEDVKQVVKVGEAKALANPFTHVSGAAFTKWSTQQNGVGGTAYTVGQTITVGANEKGITLYAQWGERAYTNSATLTYKPNGATGSDVTETVGSDSSTSFNAQLAVNPFTPPTGWIFGGWNEAANGSGTLYQAGATFAMSKDANKTLYAQWYRVNSDGSITVPGSDGNPTTENDNVTANGNGTQNPTRDDATGNITIPAGGSVTTKDGTTIVVPDGAILKPDGTLEINKPDGNGNSQPDDGKIEIKLPNGTPSSKDENGTADNKTVVTLTYTINNGENDEVKVYAASGDKVKAIANPFTWDNNHFFLNWMLVGSSPMVEYSVDAEITVGNSDMELGAQWAKKNADGSVELPGKDGILEGNNGEEKDNVTVKPDGDNGTIAPQPDGSVKVEDTDGGTVTRPDPDDNTGDTKEDVKVPDGTIVKPDGTIVLPEPAPNGTEIGPDTKLPDGLPANSDYIVVTYDPGTGSGDVIKQIVKKTDTVTAMANPFTAPGGMVFDCWQNGNTTYQVGAALPVTQSLTLTAQWKSGLTWQYTATITFHDNIDDTTISTQTIGSVDSTTITAALNANTFTAPSGWSFMGWSTAQNGTANGTFYKDGASVTLKDKATLDLYAIWYKQDGNNIVLPGVDGKADTSDDLTVKPGTGTAPTVKNDNGEGYVEAETGNQIEKKDPVGTIEVITGPVQVYPDGTVKVPEGSKVQLPDGTIVDGPATINPDNTVDKDGDDKPKRDGDDIILPGKDGKLDDPYDADNVTVTPDKDDNGNDNSTIDPDTGDVTLPDGGKVTYPDGTEVEAPDGSIVHPDGSIEFPNTDEEGSITPPNGGNPSPIPGGSKIDADGVVTYRYTIKFSGVSRGDDHVMVKAGATGTYTAPHFNNYTVDKQSATWTGGNQPFTITFTYTQGSTTPPSTGGGGGGTVSYTITASAGNGGSITPSGKVSVSSGNDKAFIITADNGYRIKDVVVDGKSVGAVSAYAFEKVKANHTISVTFEAAKPASGENVADPDDTGVSGWLRVTDHSAYMNGYGNGKFGPNDTLTRAQAAQLFYNLLVNKNVEITVSFTDVPEDAWCATAVNTLASLGIVNGVGGGKFDPNSNITRGQFAAIATRFAKAVSGVTESPFSDVSSSDWYFSSVVTAVSYGWIQGYNNGTFGPQDDVTRAQAATIVNRMLARSADRDYINGHSDLVQFTDVNANDWFYYQVMEAANGHSYDYNVDGYEFWINLQK